MAHEIETMAYAGEMPWHGLGVQVSNDMTPEEMLTAANLDWTVSKRQLYFPLKTEEGESPILRVTPGQFALIRDTDQSVLDIVGDKWKPVQNREAFEFFKRFVAAGDMRMETAGSLKNGRYVWALARLNEEFTLAKGDKSIAFLLLSLPHQFGSSITAALTPTRVVCWNTLNYALGSKLDGSSGDNSAHFRMPHSTEFSEDIKRQAEITLGLAHEKMQAFSHVAEFLSETPARHDDVIDYFHQVLQIDQPEPEESETEVELSKSVIRFDNALRHAPGQDLNSGTWWSAFNAVTYAADHLMCRDSETRLASAWFGPHATMKRRALTLANEYAQAA